MIEIDHKYKKDPASITRTMDTIDNTVFKFNCSDCVHARYNALTGRWQCVGSLISDKTVSYSDFLKDEISCKLYKTNAVLAAEVNAVCG